MMNLLFPHVKSFLPSPSIQIRSQYSYLGLSSVRSFLSMPFLGAVLLLSYFSFFIFDAYNNKASAEVIGISHFWTAATYKSDGNLVCNMWSKPELSSGKYTKRGDVHAFVTHYPSDKNMGQVSLDMGYTIGLKEIEVIVDNKKSFLFEAQGEHAYAKSSDSSALIAAFRKGSSMVVKSRSSRGTDTKDRFSLKGFTKANDQINKNCKG